MTTFTEIITEKRMNGFVTIATNGWWAVEDAQRKILGMSRRERIPDLRFHTSVRTVWNTGRVLFFWGAPYVTVNPLLETSVLLNPDMFGYKQDRHPLDTALVDALQWARLCAMIFKNDSAKKDVYDIMPLHQYLNASQPPSWRSEEWTCEYNILPKNIPS